MAQRPLKRSLEYKERVRDYATNLARRYRVEIAEVFLKDVALAQKQIADNCHSGTPAPYLMLEQKVILRELYFTSGPARYCLVYEINEDYIGLITLWHGRGSRSQEDLIRVWN